MENASLVALSRQLVLRRQLDVIANNIANLSTSGYKRQSLAMTEFHMPEARANTFERSDRINSYVEDWTTTTNFEPGSVELTGGPLDVAIEGRGFFVVKTPDGDRYTRSGNFQANREGKLVTPEGYAVQSTAGDIVFAPNEAEIRIGPDGTISTTAGVKGKIQLVGFENEATLEKIANNIYSSSAAPIPNPGGRMTQGAVEGSNVSGVTEMTRMLEVTRAYESISKLATEQNELRSKAINKLGDLRS